MISEENVTKSILIWLHNNGWKIISYDFPQSGTGVVLHPNSNTSQKNKNMIIPDIIAIKTSTCIIMENKNRFFYKDYEKINELKCNNQYSNDIDVLLQKYNISSFYYGIGLPSSKHKKKSLNSMQLVDFILGVNDDQTISILYDEKNCFKQ